MTRFIGTERNDRSGRPTTARTQWRWISGTFTQFFGSLGVVYLLTQLIGSGPAPDPDVDHQALIDTELAALDALDL